MMTLENIYSDKTGFHFERPKLLKVGNMVKIGQNVSIGEVGFGFERDDNGYVMPPVRRPHEFGVIIEDNVEIGSNSVIHRGRWRDTQIKKGAKIDSLVHIAHNAIIGENTFVVAGTVIGGSVDIGDHCFIGENVSIKQGVKITNNVTIGMGTIVRHDILEPNTTWANKVDIGGNIHCAKIADEQKF